MLAPPTAQVLDRLTALAADLLEAPLALLTVVDADRQHFLSLSLERP